MMKIDDKAFVFAKVVRAETQLAKEGKVPEVRAHEERSGWHEGRHDGLFVLRDANGGDIAHYYVKGTERLTVWRTLTPKPHADEFRDMVELIENVECGSNEVRIAVTGLASLADRSVGRLQPLEEVFLYLVDSGADDRYVIATANAIRASYEGMSESARPNLYAVK